jgi:hypothetical protein
METLFWIGVIVVVIAMIASSGERENRRVTIPATVSEVRHDLVIVNAQNPRTRMPFSVAIPKYPGRRYRKGDHIYIPFTI